ncbi:universal stress protein [Listeria fleischmannii]|jgi:nucleotide-binding universal stress UspA family protein|uniref:Universal stress protein n=1 Tax=Listeria fleischmannii TaxID=1069827 RepID=A0A841YFZ1_9LIST|nr:universal stress protein [Listeria fleischmannii]EIA20546.1 universal stress protein A [Listeria fleischmannii subsp. coloradonensis]MBC1399028.1 universal stress protein [Listeria fleischmannii]MBC1419864.1 universal stress protein [Listeria fleischmannii]MBC1427281.1 universal stress protein [Listeria fleischmannii]STY34631.1 Putative universal stress protein SAV1710 [Listeria fleischmannii subsp. coloradonensis]
MTEKNNILVAVDGSKAAYEAFVEALKYKETAKITLLSVIDQAIPNDQEFYLSPQYQILPEVDEFELLAENYLNQLAENAHTKHHIEKVVLEGNANKCIVQYATEHAIDLIILGKTEKNLIERVVLGQTATYVTKHAPCEVLVK